MDLIITRIDDDTEDGAGQFVRDGSFPRRILISAVVGTYFGDGSPSASHSMMKGLSFSPCCATWNSISSVGGCLMMRGGEWTEGGENGDCISVDALGRMVGCWCELNMDIECLSLRQYAVI